ncbi:DUF3089 domain-containing protein [Sphingomonas lutea]|uniref:DUF3089 domain-containing protein n=1 Tax=Sphingomonas lutea TaxID=1045317 RepID=A0A7G9SF49_9SPHN|nr:DUF3089 domain-containing protein [Sphingomonas lutea]QNN66474.1 DUF3089 domain-containing protein [Sphingomonas lutea]
MCARRFLIVIFVLTLLGVAGAFAIFQFGQRVLISQATPKGHFAPPPTSDAPDYSRAENWLASADLPDNPSHWRPENDAGSTEPSANDVSVFYVHPTTYLSRDSWNAQMRPDAQTEARTRLFVQSQASVFAQDATVWAPRYRQAAYGAFLLRSDDAQKALDLAYADVAAAFDAFVRRNPQRPLILAAHSQGALHLSRLLRERAGAVKGRLVAAYVVGWPLSTAADLPAIGLPGCSRPDQTGCVLSWQSFGQPANPDLITDAWVGTLGPTGMKRERKDMLCVNPITGTAGGAAPPSANLGTLVPSADLASATIEPGRVGARCDNGLLLIDGAIPPLGAFVLPGNNHHVYDYALFWASVREDARRRIAAWQR